MVTINSTANFTGVSLDKFHVYAIPHGGDDRVWDIICEERPEENISMISQTGFTLTDEQARMLLKKMTSQMLEKNKLGEKEL